MFPSILISVSAGEDGMKYKIEASCGCNVGKIRKNNEDNFWFDGKYLDADNIGSENTVNIFEPLKKGCCFAVFDGMGGEDFGEIASYAAAREMQQIKRKPSCFFVSEKNQLLKLSSQLNDAVVQAKREMCTDRMGTTMVALIFSSRHVHVSNVGDSRAYRLRNGELRQISVDHIDKSIVGVGKKAPLTQHLGIDPNDMQIVPYIAKEKIQSGDIYLLCSDGLTDMLTDLEITDIMLKHGKTDACVSKLIDRAIERGGRDNITAIVCKIT